MGFLSGKPKIGIEQLCQQFYDSQIFRAAVAGEDLWLGFLETVFESVAAVDQSFATIQLALLNREITALRLELFALAWGHKFKHERFTIPQSVFTRRYLEGAGKLELWDTMGEYNQVVSRSATLTATGEQMEGRIARGRIAYLNELRFSIWKKWAETNIGDPSAPTEQEKTLLNCVARVANRIGADIRQNDCILVKRLTARLADRLDCDPDLSAQALFKLGAVIFGLYEGAMEAIKSVNL